MEQISKLEVLSKAKICFESSGTKVKAMSNKPQKPRYPPFIRKTLWLLYNTL